MYGFSVSVNIALAGFVICTVNLRVGTFAADHVFAVEIQADDEAWVTLDGSGPEIYINKYGYTPIYADKLPVFVAVKYTNERGFGGLAIQGIRRLSKLRKITTQDVWYCKVFVKGQDLSPEWQTMDFDEAYYGWTKATSVRTKKGVNQLFAEGSSIPVNFFARSTSFLLKRVTCRGYLPDINECKSNPCKSGTCINKRGRYACVCNLYTKGTRCEEALPFSVHIEADYRLNFYMDGEYAGTVWEKRKRFEETNRRPIFVSFALINEDAWGGFFIEGSYLSMAAENVYCREAVIVGSACFNGFVTNDWLSLDFKELKSWTTKLISEKHPLQKKQWFTTKTRLKTGMKTSVPCAGKITSRELFCRVYLKDINECLSDPCKAGATCHNKRGGFLCNCPPGREGPTCSLKVDQCRSSPCLNGGTCLNEETRFQCNCLPGYDGMKCHVDVDECASSPCTDFGKCTDYINRFQCTCIPGFEGDTCATNMNECASNPCGAEGTCVDLINSYSCTCGPGLTGSNCDIPLEGGTEPVRVNVGYESRGCFAFSQTHFSKAAQRGEFLTVHSATKWLAQDCAHRCRTAATYTYAGVETKNNSICRCFNNIKKLPNVTKHSETCPDDVTKYSTMTVLTTCPDAYFNPPLCSSRVGELCVGGIALYNGQCETCSSSKGQTGWRNCDVLRDFSFNIDMRYTHLTKRYKDFEDKFQQTQRAEPSRDTAGLTVCWHKPGIFLTRTDITAYIHKIKALLMAKGACFFSLWDRTKDEPMDREVKLIQKFVMNSFSDYEVKEYSDVNMIIPSHYHRSANIAVHSIDTLEPLGSPEFRYSYQGIVGFSKSEEQFQNERPRMKLLYDYDYLPHFTDRNRDYFDKFTDGWKSGKTIPVDKCWAGENCQGATGRKIYSIALKVKLLTSCPRGCARHTCASDFKCTYGCASGFIGSFCDVECEARTFGHNCEEICHIGCVNQVCNSKTGICADGCTPGYRGIFCDEICPRGTYGLGCKSVCSKNCATANNCDRRNGECFLGCAAGYEKPFCVDTCRSNKWGDSCSKDCGKCKGEESCDVITAVCAAGCEDAYMPPDCRCQAGTWGRECRNTCGSCSRNRPCDAQTGHCPCPSGNVTKACSLTNVCSLNTQPPMCVCQVGKYGANCRDNCGNCIKGFCDVAGVCTLGCTSGYTGNACNETCPPGKYGMNCTLHCPGCLEACHHVNGSCPRGKCRPNFKEPDCFACEGHLFGARCEDNCGYCSDNLKCSRTGVCPGEIAQLKSPVIRTLIQSVIATRADAIWDAAIILDTVNVSEMVNESFVAVTQPFNTSQNNSDEVQEDSAIHVDFNFQQSQFATNMRRRLAALVEPETYEDLILLLRNGILVGKHVTEEQAAILDAVVASACDADYQGPTCICGIGKHGESCSRDCGHCLGGCLRYGGCVAGCSPGWTGDGCDEPCNGSYFGSNCLFRCGACKADTPCAAVDGVCRGGCAAGYMPPYCKCALGRYGDNCQHECYHCRKGTTCSFADGTCTACDDGFLMPFCNCTYGTYGVDCNGTCGFCLMGEQCDVFSGECPGLCASGYKKPYCTEPCDPGLFGNQCQQECGHCKDCAACHTEDGSCPEMACDVGYLPPLCVELCPLGTYGESCEQKCANCFDERACSPFDGFCDEGCEMGYKSPFCWEPCPGGTWGFNCQEKCGFCANGETCNSLDGSCTACIPQFKKPYCVETVTARPEPLQPCEEFFYGPPTCQAQCGNCLSARACDGLTGECPSGCEAGFMPPLCQVACEGSYWGLNCASKCGECKDYAPCQKTDGACWKGCRDGWQGKLCSTEKSKLEDILVERSRLKNEASDVTSLSISVLMVIQSCTLVSW